MSAETAPPKAVLYVYEWSVWAGADIFPSEEKGYGEDEIETRQVDVVKGETFAPSFLRINPKGTVPTLVAPLANTLDASSETKYRALTDTKSVLEFLDKSRSNLSKTHTTSHKPAPSLTPATVDGSALSKLLIDLVHADENDPNFLQITAKDDAELKEKADGFLGKVFVSGRAKALDEYLAQEDLIPKIKNILEEKKRGAVFLNAVYLGKATAEEKAAFFAKSKEAWEVAVPKTLATLESHIVGPYTLGDQLSLADLHVGVWLAKMVVQANGGIASDPTKWPELITQLGPAVGDKDFKVGPKVTAFWNEIITRDAFKKVYEKGLH
ncbi:glutathione S-transferase [Ceratobasidium sp. AG-Ba]|nr:glutathione S-transferase [Ceratobasidium sp. AG-Ba]